MNVQYGNCYSKTVPNIVNYKCSIRIRKYESHTKQQIAAYARGWQYEYGGKGNKLK